MNQPPTITPTPVDILPCPYCGCVEMGTSTHTKFGYSWIYCQDCQAAGPGKSTEAEAIAAWNEVARKCRNYDEIERLSLAAGSAAMDGTP